MANFISAGNGHFINLDHVVSIESSEFADETAFHMDTGETIVKEMSTEDLIMTLEGAVTSLSPVTGLYAKVVDPETSQHILKKITHIAVLADGELGYLAADPKECVGTILQGKICAGMVECRTEEEYEQAAGHWMKEDINDEYE